MEKSATSAGEIPCWKHLTEFWSVNGRSFDKSCAAGFKAYGLGSVLPENLLLTSEKVPVSCGPALLGGLQVKTVKSVEIHPKCCVEWRWEVRFYGPQCQIWDLYNVLM